MRLAVDATPLLGPGTGVATFTAGALEALGRRPDVEPRAYALSWRGRGLLKEVLPDGVTAGWAAPAGPLLRLWTHTDLVPAEWLADLEEGVDVVHGTNFVVPPSKRAARVVTVHDLTAVRFPELCTATSRRYPGLVRRAVRTGAWVHTPSEHVAGEVCEAFGADPGRVRAVPHGLGVQAHVEAAADRGATAEAGRRLAAQLIAAGGADRGGAGGPTAGGARAGPAGLQGGDAGLAGKAQDPLAQGRRYVLALGTVEPRKDLPLLVRAFDGLAGDRPDLGLVIAGPDGWGAGALDAAVSAARHGDRIGRPGYVDGVARAALLAGAAVFAFPSVYEGFGLPPLEAMAAGVPVVATAAGAVPEVVGAAGVLVPPGDTDAFAGALGGVLDDADRASALATAGRVRAAAFTWDRCAAGLTALYEDALDDQGACG